jgi:hypothetical protein
MNAKNLLKLGAGGVLCGSVYVFILVASIFIFGALLFLPEYFGFDDFMIQQMRHNGWMAFVAIPALIIQLVFPFFAARWFYRISDPPMKGRASTTPLNFSEAPSRLPKSPRHKLGVSSRVPSNESETRTANSNR